MIMGAPHELGMTGRVPFPNLVPVQATTNAWKGIDMKTRVFQSGYTLIELLTALSVMTTLLAMGIPALGDLIENTRVQTGSRALSESLTLARNEAVKRNTRVVMCKSRDGVRCDHGLSWEQGWIVFPDVNGNGLADPGEAVIYREILGASSLRMAANQPVADYVAYVPSGRTRKVSGAFQAGTFTVCSRTSGQTQARQVVINNVGRPRVSVASAAACV
jgi:type IV fimbrial biogenesis protein FimT